MELGINVFLEIKYITDEYIYKSNVLLHWKSENELWFSRVVDQATGIEIASFPIYKVLFCARGQEGSVESDCFSFTESYRSSEDFQIHVFSCHIKEAVSFLLMTNCSIKRILLHKDPPVDAANEIID